MFPFSSPGGLQFVVQASVPVLPPLGSPPEAGFRGVPPASTRKPPSISHLAGLTNNETSSCWTSTDVLTHELPVQILRLALCLAPSSTDDAAETQSSYINFPRLQSL